MSDRYYTCLLNKLRGVSKPHEIRNNFKTHTKYDVLIKMNTLLKDKVNSKCGYNVYMANYSIMCTILYSYVEHTEKLCFCDS